MNVATENRTESPTNLQSESFMTSQVIAGSGGATARYQAWSRERKGLLRRRQAQAPQRKSKRRLCGRVGSRRRFSSAA